MAAHKIYYLVQAYKTKEDSKYKTHLYPNYLTSYSYNMQLGGANFGLQSGLYDAIKFESKSKAKEWMEYAKHIFKERTWEIVPVDERMFGKEKPAYILSE